MTFDIQQGQTLTGTYVVFAEGGSPNVNLTWTGGFLGMALAIPTPSSFGVSGDGWTFEVTDFTASNGATYNWSLTVPADAPLGAGSWEFSGQVAINIQSYGDFEHFVVIAGSGGGGSSGSSGSSASSGGGSGSSGAAAAGGGDGCGCQNGSGAPAANSVIPSIAGVLTAPPSCVTSNVCGAGYVLQYDSYGSVSAQAGLPGPVGIQGSNARNVPSYCLTAPEPCGSGNPASS